MGSIFYITVFLFAVFFVILLILGTKAIRKLLIQRQTSSPPSLKKNLIDKELDLKLYETKLRLYDSELSILANRIKKLEAQNRALHHALVDQKTNIRSFDRRIMFSDLEKAMTAKMVVPELQLFNDIKIKKEYA